MMVFCVLCGYSKLMGGLNQLLNQSVNQSINHLELDASQLRRSTASKIYLRRFEELSSRRIAAH